MGNWIIVENLEQLSVANDWLTGQPEPYSFLATSPAPLQALQREGADVRGIHEFTSQQALNEIAEQNFGTTTKAIDHLGGYWRSSGGPFADEYNPFEATYYLLKRAVDQVTFRSHELLNFSREMAPEKVALFDGAQWDGPNAFSQRYLNAIIFEPHESVTARLSKLGIWPESTDVQVLADPSSVTHPRTRLRAGWKGVVADRLNRNRINAARFLKRARQLTKRRTADRRFVCSGRDPSILAFLVYAWRDLGVSVDWWSFWDWNPVTLPTLAPVTLHNSMTKGSSDKRPLFEGVSSLAETALWAIEGNLSAQQLLIERLERFVTQRLDYLVHLYARGSHYMEKRRPSAFLNGESSSDAAQTMSMAAKRHGVPFVVFQHGGCYGYCDQPMLLHSDLKAADIFVSWGPGVSRDTAPTIQPDNQIRFADAGWSRVDEPVIERVQVNEVRSCTVLYVVTGMNGNQHYGPYHTLSDIDYFGHEKEVLQALAQVPNVNVVVKTHFHNYVPNPIDDYVSSEGLAHTDVVSEGRLVDLLPNADVVVIDFPSTTLLQTLIARKPVVFVDCGAHRYTEEGLKLLQEATMCVQMGEGWQKRLIEAVLEQLQGDSQLHPEAFLANYANEAYHPEKLWNSIQERINGTESGLAAPESP